MADKISTTRIVDLPENITVQMPPGSRMEFNQPMNTGMGGGGYDPQNPTYSQMNVHPNPYGNSPQNQIMPLPQPTQQQSQNQFLPQQMQMENTPQYRLPSRDIPVDTAQYSHDEQVQPNYIPPVKLTSDYIKEYDDLNEIPLREYKQKKHRESLVDRILTEIQTPIFIALLFFVFQMPIVNKLMYKNLSFLSIYNSDGNMNFYGMVLKSLIFGSIYFWFSKFTNYVSEL
jgi:hypothetical protein